MTRREFLASALGAAPFVLQRQHGADERALAGRAVHAQRAVGRADAVREPAQTRAGARHARRRCRRPGPRRPARRSSLARRTVAWVAWAYLATFVSASETVKYAVASATADSRSAGSATTSTGTGAAPRASRSRGRGHGRSAPRDGCRARARAAPPSASESSSPKRSRSGPADSGSRSTRSRADPHFERERHEPLLGAVVEVALDLAPGGVGSLDDARARSVQLRGAGRLDLAPAQRVLGLAALGDVEDRAVHPAAGHRARARAGRGRAPSARRRRHA